MPSFESSFVTDTSKTFNIPINLENLKPILINEKKTKKFFNFCIPLNRLNCDDPYEAPMTSQNSLAISPKNRVRIFILNIFIKI